MPMEMTETGDPNHAKPSLLSWQGLVRLPAAVVGPSDSSLPGRGGQGQQEGAGGMVGLGGKDLCPLLLAHFTLIVM